uniref:Uncharacterized protein n=1 Tax=Magallana gigas TaxID=29159 RepID=K1R433_MAGGI
MGIGAILFPHLLWGILSRNPSKQILFPAPKDCQDYLWEGYRKNGLYTIYPQKGGRLTSSVTSKLMEEVGRLYKDVRMAQRTFLETGWIINMVLETYLKSSGMILCTRVPENGSANFHETFRS